MTLETKQVESIADPDCLLHCHQLVVGWQSQALLPALDLTVKRGEFIAVVGRNGSGKTTLLKTLLGFIPAIAGSLNWASQNVPKAYLPQRSVYDELFPASVLDVVSMGTESGYGFFGPWRPRSAQQKVQLALERTHTKALANLAFADLSEGQKQRVLLAQVVACEPSLVLLDEPTAAMDVHAEAEILEVIDALRRQYQLAVIMVSHHLGVAQKYASQVLFVDRERQSILLGSADDVFAQLSPQLTQVSLGQAGKPT